MRSIEVRLAKLETGNRGAAIVAWCDDPADVEITVSAMIAEGQISVADRERLLLVLGRLTAFPGLSGLLQTKPLVGNKPAPPSAKANCMGAEVAPSGSSELLKEKGPSSLTKLGPSTLLPNAGFEGRFTNAA